MLDLQKLAKKLDEALANETPETLTAWLREKRFRQMALDNNQIYARWSETEHLSNVTAQPRTEHDCQGEDVSILASEQHLSMAA